MSGIRLQEQPAASGGQYLVEMGAVGVGDEDLPEGGVGYHHLYYPAHTRGVKLVKKVVEQQ